MPFRNWRHVFKLDPDRSIHEHDLKRICESGTDAIIVGGSTGVHYDNTEQLLLKLQSFDLPCALEVSSLDAAVPGFDLYFIPVVLNTRDVRWMIGEHHDAVKRYGDFIPWNRVYAEGYIILNEHAKAAQVSEANTDLTAEDVIAYTQIADQIYRLPIVYIEYSGTFGNLEVSRQALNAARHAQVFYGGGIDCANKARQAAECADTVIVGNAIYDDLERALETVEIVKQTPLIRSGHHPLIDKF